MARTNARVLPPFYRTLLQAYAAKVGGQHILAEELKVSRLTVNRWLNGWRCGKYEDCIALATRVGSENPELVEVAGRTQPPPMNRVQRVRFVQDRLGVSYRKAAQVVPILYGDT